jgi:transposase
VRHYGRVGGETAALLRVVRELEPSAKLLVFIYEAGPCGFGIHRTLSARGHECWVVAPSNTPRRVRDRIKTYRRDAMKLAGQSTLATLSYSAGAPIAGNTTFFNVLFTGTGSFVKS